VKIEIMKAHYNKFTLKQKQMIRAGVAEEFKRQSGSMTRRVFKLFCVALNQEFGFGKKRLAQLIQAIEDIGAQREQDEVFWAHVDRLVNEQIGMSFEPEDYDKMDE